MNCIAKMLICLSLPLITCPFGVVVVNDAIKEGNFLLPASQQPGPLFSIGQNIVEKGDKIGSCYTLGLPGCQQYNVLTVPNFLYGISNTCSILFAVPYSFLKSGTDKAAGISDVFAQLEYAFYGLGQATYSYQATILARAVAPTGSVKTVPVIGEGGPRFQFGLTASYYSTDWFYFVSTAGTIAVKGQNIRANNTFLYEAGFGRNITTLPGWIFAGVIEFNGRYQSREYIYSVVDRNSGFNIIFCTPSLWVSSKRFVLQAGVTFLPVQHLFGCQTRINTGGVISMAWKFNT